MKGVLTERKEKTFVVSEGRGVLPRAPVFVSNSQLGIQTYFTPHVSTCFTSQNQTTAWKENRAIQTHPVLLQALNCAKSVGKAFREVCI